MTGSKQLLITLLLLSSLTILLLAQHGPGSKNPLEGKPDAIESGKRTYDAMCAGCHGSKGDGGHGPAVNKGSFKHGNEDAQLFEVIKNGVSGTAMPAMGLKDDEVWQVVSFLRAMGGGGAEKITGNVAAGETFFKANCVGCHMVNGAGSRYAPDLSTIGMKIDRLLSHHNALRRGMGVAEIKAASVLDSLREIAPQVLPYADAVWDILDGHRRKGNRILFEGAQGVLLDIDHGTYPYVTSSNTVAGQAAAGSGMGPSAVNYVLGIAKAYTTRVGGGPFPTEQANDIGEWIGQRGREFGTVTGRKRRCGWFDAVLARQAIKTSGIQGIALTKLDVLDGLKEIKVGVGYMLDGKKIERYPAAEEAQKRVVPIYESFEGWEGTTAGARSWNALPGQAVKYVRFLEELIECPVALLSTSPERDDTILMKDPFAD